MARVFVLVFAALTAAAAESMDQDNATTFEELYIERYHENIHDWSLRQWYQLVDDQESFIRRQYRKFSGKLTKLPLTDEVFYYHRAMYVIMMYEVASIVANMTVQSICQDLNDHCGDYLETPIEDLRVEPSNVTCVTIQLKKTLIMKIKTAMDVALQVMFSECDQQRMSLCKKVSANCTTAYDERTRKLLDGYIEEKSELESSLGSTPVEIIAQFLVEAMRWLAIPYNTGHTLLMGISYYNSSVPSIEPFTITNLIYPTTDKEVETLYLSNYSTIQSQEQSTWGIVRSDAGRVALECSNYKNRYSQYSRRISAVGICYYRNALKANLDLMRCSYSGETWNPLALSTVHSAFFHSQCLCLAYNGTKCGVTAPQGVDPRIYCLSVLLRDFQRQVSYRPAVTYLDYAFKTRVPVCQFSNLLQVSFKRTCEDSNRTLHFVQSVQCHFKGLVNKQLNCSETRRVNSYNITELCNLRMFMQFVICDGGDDVEVPVTFYGFGDSPMVLFLTYGDVVVRVLTMVTYLACKQLRNLPGKLLVAYLATALLRLVVVRATLADMTMAVRLDVALDLSSTLCLTAYLHFLTVSIRDLRPPDSLSRDEARRVLIRYSLLGWVLPAALSTAFFSIDYAIESHVQVGQLMFLLCNYVALFANLYMFSVNFIFYYEVRISANQLKKGERKREVFAALFNFAVKTSVLSGAGITLRLVFTQIQGLEQLLGYYHVLGSLQGLLVFLLYGCNHEALAFWLQVFRSLISRFRRRQNLPV